MITLIDYDAGNMMSVEKALRYLGAEVCVTNNARDLAKADKILLPGVGAFGEAMKKIRALNLDRVIRETIEKGTPFLGICLGMQILFEGSEESPGVEGLGVLKGEIRRIPEGDGIKIPHMGWNALSVVKESRLFKEEEDPYVYFVHSYYLKAEEEDIVAARTWYGTEIDVAVEKERLYACQFHPEKSGRVGLRILKRFIEMDLLMKD